MKIKYQISLFSALVLILLFLSCDKKVIINEPLDEVINKVIIIGIDGCMPAGIVAANTPNLDNLMSNGTFSLDARNLGTTSSGPSWSSMLTGVWQEKHKVRDNSFSGSNFSEYPHFFKRIEDFNSALNTVSICQWHPINDEIVGKNADVIINSEDSSLDTGNKSVSSLTGDVDAMFVHFDDVDHAGHGSGFSPTNPAYLSAIEKVDVEIGRIIQAIENRENKKENWIIIVSTDHGGIGNSHGGDTDEERTIFLIVSGDNVPSKEIKKTTSEVVVQPVDNCLNADTELYFNGESKIEVPNNDLYNFGADQDFSLECRIRSTNPGDVSIVAKKDWVSGSLPGFVFSFKPNTKNFKINVGDGSNRVDVEAGEITDNEWHTVSASFDRDGMVKVYVDGAFVKSSSMSAIGDINNNYGLTIGADGENDYKYRGYISEVRLFSTLLNDSEISDWSCKILDASHPKYEFLSGHWKLDEASGSIIKDSSPNSQNGELINGGWKNAKESTTSIISNFDATPRTIDVVKTALNHLCIPVHDSWNIDGTSWIDTDCK